MAKKQDKKEFIEWMATVEHQSFVEYMRLDLETQGILMQDIDL